MKCGRQVPMSQPATFIFLAQKHLTTTTSISYRGDLTQNRIKQWVSAVMVINMSVLQQQGTSRMVNNYVINCSRKFLYHGASYVNEIDHPQ
jgi:hypothetical protein